MDAQKEQRQAENVVRMIFGDAQGNEMSRDEILKKISPKTFLNYSPMLYNAGLTIPIKGDNQDTRKITKLRLTARGVEVVRGDKPDAATVKLPSTSTPDSSPQIVTLQSISDLVDKWNEQNPSFWIDPTPRRRATKGQPM